MFFISTAMNERMVTVNQINMCKVWQKHKWMNTVKYEGNGKIHE
jgi:hypothetical protein